MSLSGKLSLAKNAITSTVGRQALISEKNSPHVLFGVGMVGFAATVVLASKATLHVEEILDERDEYKDHMTRLLVDKNEQRYDDSAYNKDARLLTVRTAGKVARLYAPAGVAAVVTVGCLAKSHQIMTRRNAAITAAFVAVDQAFKQYRSRVVDNYGEEVDRFLRHDFEVQTVIAETETGPQEAEIFRPRTDVAPSMYAAFFNERNQNWNPRPEMNVVFLRQQQNWINDRLQVKGHVFLNEVYDLLGLDRTKAGSVVGWLKKDEFGEDNYIDFGVFNVIDGVQADRVYDFITGRENEMLLDFNVDGVIYDKLGR